MENIQNLSKENKIQRLIIETGVKTTQMMIHTDQPEIDISELYKIFELIEDKTYYIIPSPMFIIDKKTYNAETYGFIYVEELEKLIMNNENNFFVFYNVFLSPPQSGTNLRRYFIRGKFIEDKFKIKRMNRNKNIDKILDE